jgi:hypothetical protein
MNMAAGGQGEDRVAGMVSNGGFDEDDVRLGEKFSLGQEDGSERLKPLSEGVRRFGHAHSLELGGFPDKPPLGFGMGMGSAEESGADGASLNAGSETDAAGAGPEKTTSCHGDRVCGSRAGWNLKSLPIRGAC